MKQYLDIVKDVLVYGCWKETRTGDRAITSFGQVFRHNMQDGFPLLTTKEMAYRSMWTELEGFIKGITSKKWYQDRGCNIWNEWSNPLNDNDNDLGPIYGYQWRRFNHVFDEDDDGCMQRYDQFDTILQTLKHNPDSRRMVCSAWNPIQADRMALPPCHVLWNVVVIEDRINLIWHQRSWDLMLGNPFNIASYATLLLLLAQESGLIPGILQGTFADCHIYENQIEGAKEQVLREPRDLPTVDLGRFACIYDWSSQHTTIDHYNPHPKINFPVAV